MLIGRRRTFYRRNLADEISPQELLTEVINPGFAYG
jgi:hypothetical protein